MRLLYRKQRKSIAHSPSNSQNYVPPEIIPHFDSFPHVAKRFIPIHKMTEIRFSAVALNQISVFRGFYI